MAVKLPELDMNLREIASDEEELEEETKMYHLFQSSDIKIQYPRNMTYHENKCIPCNVRFMEEDTYLSHTSTCVMVHLDELYKRLETLSQMRLANQIDREEFVLRALYAIHKTKARTDSFYDAKKLADIELCDSSPIFDEDAAIRNRKYHEKQEKKRAHRINLTNNQQVTNQTINMHFTNSYSGYNRVERPYQKF